MRKKIRNAGLKRIITAICAIAVIAAALTYTFTLSRDRSAVYGAEPISASVGIGDNTYTKTEKPSLMCIVTKSETPVIEDILKDHPECFAYTEPVSKVFGYFDKKIKKEK